MRFGIRRGPKKERGGGFDPPALLKHQHHHHHLPTPIHPITTHIPIQPTAAPRRRRRRPFGRTTPTPTASRRSMWGMRTSSPRAPSAWTTSSGTSRVRRRGCWGWGWIAVWFRGLLLYHTNPPTQPLHQPTQIGLRADLRNAGVKAPIGTAQRINEWLSPSPELDRLAAACDVIGVNMYVRADGWTEGASFRCGAGVGVVTRHRRCGASLAHNLTDPIHARTPPQRPQLPVLLDAAERGRGVADRQPAHREHEGAVQCRAGPLPRTGTYTLTYPEHCPNRPHNNHTNNTYLSHATQNRSGRCA